MSNDQCAAIIKAIGAATEFLFTYGVSLRDKIIDADSDAGAKTADIALLTAALEDIIEDLPAESQDEEP